MQLRRNRSTRSLWDPAYVDETWINDRVQLVRRLRNWVNAYYPGTAIGITEYNWGAENHINGATTQADIYGIFGREGLDMAARWTTPAWDGRGRIPPALARPSPRGCTSGTGPARTGSLKASVPVQYCT